MYLYYFGLTCGLNLVVSLTGNGNKVPSCAELFKLVKEGLIKLSKNCEDVQKSAGLHGLLRSTK